MVVKKVIKETPKEKAHEPVEVPAPSPVKRVGEGFCVECGEPIAPGQTYVCTAHIRAG